MHRGAVQSSLREGPARPQRQDRGSTTCSRSSSARSRRGRAELPRIAAHGVRLGLPRTRSTRRAVRGSLYAVKDPFRLDPRFRDQDGDKRRRADPPLPAPGRASPACSVMTDLVINHAAKDAHADARSGPTSSSSDEAGKLAAPTPSIPDDHVEDEWGDLAELDYHREACARVPDPATGTTISRTYRSLGVKGFRCDAAYKVPAEVWEHSDRGRQGARPGLPLRRRDARLHLRGNASATAGAGFDYLFNSFAWWDLKAPWALEDYERLRRSRPRSPSPRTTTWPASRAEGGETDPERLARLLTARYALAAFFSAGRADADRLRVGLPQARCMWSRPARRTARARASTSRDAIAADEPRSRRSPGLQRRGRAMAPLGAPDASCRGAAALRRRPPGRGADTPALCSPISVRRISRSIPRRSCSKPAGSAPSRIGRRMRSRSPSNLAARSG